jgi:hypothetical protein
VLIAGGLGSAGTLASAELYDPATGMFSNTGSLATGRDYATATLLPGGNVLVAGGLGNSYLASAELYTPPTPPVIELAIDIRPNIAINTISRTTGTVVPVAILSSATFNALTAVNRTSLTFGRVGTEASLIGCNARGQDVNADGRLDLVCQFNGTLGGFLIGDTLGVLRGLTTGGAPIHATDSVNIIQ